jgi:hypothetical protein
MDAQNKTSSAIRNFEPSRELALHEGNVTDWLHALLVAGVLRPVNTQHELGDRQCRKKWSAMSSTG